MTQGQTEALRERIAELEEDLQFVERWAVHHGSKPSVSAKEALSAIQHYPSIKAITDSYADGKRPDTFNPYARIAELEAGLAALKAAPDAAAVDIKAAAEAIAVKVAKNCKTVENLTFPHIYLGLKEFAAALRATPPAPASDAWRTMIEGMSVSVDVSTGEHGAGNRYFGTVTEVMDDPESKHGVTLLIQDAKPNFALAAPQAQDVQRDAIRALIAKHNAELEHNHYAYFELAYTRQTGWMAWITDHPRSMPHQETVKPDRKVLASGQGDTAEAACAAAIAASAKGGV